jgi:hypothetical protein
MLFVIRPIGAVIIKRWISEVRIGPRTPAELVGQFTFQSVLTA